MKLIGLYLFAFLLGGFLGWRTGGWDVRRMKKKYGPDWWRFRWWNYR